MSPRSTGRSPYSTDNNCGMLDTGPAGLFASHMPCPRRMPPTTTPADCRFRTVSVLGDDVVTWQLQNNTNNERRKQIIRKNIECNHLVFTLSVEIPTIYVDHLIRMAHIGTCEIIAIYCDRLKIENKKKH